MRDHLTTARLTLRPFAADDLEALVALDSDPAVMRFLTNGKPTPRDVIATTTLPSFMAPRGAFQPWVWAIEQDGTFLGWASLKLLENESGWANEADLGYRLKQSAWGKGYASEAARALVDHGFGVWKLDRICAETMAVNAASRRVMEKAGLRYVRTFHVAFDDPIPGTEEGEVEYAVTREDWLRAKES